MKPIIVTLHKDRRKGQGTSFHYPACWYGNEKRIKVLAYEDTGEIGSDVRERCIAVIPDDLFEEFIRDPEISLIENMDKANILIGEWRSGGKPTRPIINDKDALVDALVREDGSLKKPSERTKLMERVLDPDDPTPGLVKRPPLDIKNYLNKE